MRHAVQIRKLFLIGPALGILGAVGLVALAVGMAAYAALLAVFTASFHWSPHFSGLRLFVWIFYITNRNHSFSISTYRVVCYAEKDEEQFVTSWQF